jgi:hypothetical protein
MGAEPLACVKGEDRNGSLGFIDDSPAHDRALLITDKVAVGKRRCDQFEIGSFSFLISHFNCSFKLS